MILIPPNDIFRWKCVAIVESLIEGSTMEQAKEALFDYVLANGGVGSPYDPELCQRALDFEKLHGR